MQPLDLNNQSVRYLLESITDGFYFLDPNWTVLYFNKQAERILQIPREDITGTNLWTRFPEEYGKEFYKRFKYSFESQQALHFEEYLDRLAIWGELTVYPSPAGISVHFRDISERKKQEFLLREMNHNYTMILKATSGAIWEYQGDKRTYHWHNEHFKELFGYDIVDVPVSDSFWHSLIHPEDRQQRLKQLTAQIQNGYEVDRCEYRFLKADGTYANVLERTFLERNASGEMVKLIGCTEDITKVKRAEGEVRNSDANHRLLFEKSSLAQLICNQNTLRILKVNQAAREMYGYTNEEFMALDVADLRPAGNQKTQRRRIEEARSSKHTLRYIANHVRKSGERLIVEVSLARMEYDGVPCFLIALNDQTHRKHLEKQIVNLRLINQKNVARAAIEAQEKQKEEIAKELHDNINQVLATIKLILSCVKGANKRHHELLEQSKNSITYCIEEIRRLSRSFTPPSLGEISLEAAILNLVQSIPFVKGEKVEVMIKNVEDERLDDGFKVTVYRIIQEQLNNILKYAEASKITVGLSQTSSHLTLLIADDGKGFDVNAKRSGLGLNNIKNRADLYNGRLSIQSTAGAGCTVQIEFLLDAEARI
jgi:PAS domain S-box-containing protein